MYKIQDYNCPTNLTVQDLVANQDMGYLQMKTFASLNRCINTTDVVCKSPEEIEAALRGVVVSFFYVGNDWRPGNKFPVQHFIDASLAQGIDT